MPPEVANLCTPYYYIKREKHIHLYQNREKGNNNAQETWINIFKLSFKFTQKSKLQ